MVEAFDKIREFIIKARWEYEFSLEKETRLYEDLKIYGDDAVDFFLKFSEEFNVDVSSFEIAKYFKGEGFPVLRLFGKDSKNMNNRPHITLGDLERAIEAGRLDESVIGK